MIQRKNELKLRVARDRKTACYWCDLGFVCKEQPWLKKVCRLMSKQMKQSVYYIIK